MIRYLPLLAYPLLPAVSGVVLATHPLMMAGLFAVLLLGLLWKGSRRRVGKHLALPGLPRGFPVPIAALCAVGLLEQAVAAFLLGMGLVAGWQVGWLLPYAIVPSLFLVGELEIQRRRLR